MMIRLIELICFERIEIKMNTSVHANFKSDYQALKVLRNSLAHTYAKGPAATLSTDVPSVTKVRFSRVLAGLDAYDKALRKL